MELIEQIDVSNDLEVSQSSETQLYEYVGGLKEIVNNLSGKLIGCMHANMKQFGNTLKAGQKENNKNIKKVAQTYNASKKKADKIRNDQKNSSFELDKASIRILEDESDDLEAYKLYVDWTSKRFKRDIVNVYKICNNTLKIGPIIKLKKSDKDKFKIVDKQRSVSPTKDCRRLPKSKLSEQKVIKPIIADTAKEERKEAKYFNFNEAKYDSSKHLTTIKESSTRKNESSELQGKDTDDEAPFKEWEDQDIDGEGDKEVVNILEQDAAQTEIRQPRSSIVVGLNSNNNIDRKSFISNRLSEILGKDNQALIQFQNYMTEN